MFDFSKICKSYAKMTDEERRQVLLTNSAEILSALDDTQGDKETVFILFVMTACGASGKLEFEEYKLFRDVTGIELDYDTACALVDSAATRESRNVVDIIVDIFGLFSEELKASMVSFCLCFCAANGKIDSREKKFIKRLLK